MEKTGQFIARKLADAGSFMYRNVAFPFVKMGIERKCNSIIGKGTYLYNGTTLEGKDYIGDKVELANVKVGYSVYIAPNASISDTIIGNYSCIGDIKTVIGRHPVKGECVSIHPAFYSSAAQFGYTYVKDGNYEEAKYVDEDKKYNIKIGNDVWIGFGVMITDGVTIGDGAVIGARSLVTTDVGPYEIYAGTPARKIGMRFDEETVSKLKELRWWDKGEAWIAEHATEFCDPAVFFENVR